MNPIRQSLLFFRWMCFGALLLLGGSASAEPRTDRLGDPLPEGAIARLGTMRLRHDDGIAAVVFAPDGKTLASGDRSGVVRVWETASGRELHCLRGSYGQFPNLAYSPNGKLLAWGGREGIDLWDTATGAKRGHLEGQCQNVRGVAFSPDGKTLMGLMDGPVHCWDVATQRRLHEREGEGLRDHIWAAAFSPDGKTLVVADCEKKEVRRCEAASGKSLGKLCDAKATSLAYSPDGKRLAIAADRNCLVCDAVSGEIVDRIPKPCKAVAYAPDGRTIAGVGVWSSNPWLFELSRRELRWLESGQVCKEQKVLAFSPDSKLLATAGEDQLVRLWDVRTGKEGDLLDGEASSERQFVISGNGKVLAALDADHSVRVWDTDSGKIVCRWDVTHPDSSSLALSPDGTLLTMQALRGSSAHVLHVFDTTTGRCCWNDPLKERILFAAISVDGSLLATGPDGENIELWEAKTGKRLSRLIGQQRRGIAGAFAPDGKTLITASLDHSLCVWDMPERRERQRLKGHGCGAWVWHIAFSADGTRLVTGGNDGRVCLWDPRSGQRLRLWATEHDEGVTCVALSPDGRIVLANSGCDTFRLWDTTTGTATASIPGHRDTITHAAFRADGRTCVTASRDGTALVWDVAALRRRQPLPLPIAPVRADCYGDPLPPGTLARLGSIRLQHKNGVHGAVFSPDGNILAAFTSGDQERSLRLWDVHTGKELRRLSEERMPSLQQIAFSPDGKPLAGMDGDEIRLWDVASGAYLGVAVRHTNSLSVFAFSPDGTKIAAGWSDVGGKSFKVYLWDLDSGELLHVFDGHRSSVQQIAFTADGKTLLSASSGQAPVGPEVCVWDVASGKRRGRHEIGATLASNGETMAFAEKEQLHVRDAVGGRELWFAKIGQGDFCYSLDSKYLLIRVSNQSLRLYDSASGKELRCSERVWGELETVLSLSADGALLATECFDNILLWDTKTGRERRPFAGHRSFITCLSFAPDGRTLLSASARGSVRIWDPARAKELRLLREPGPLVTAVAFSPDGRRIACADRGNVVSLWDAATGAEVGRCSIPASKKTLFFESVQCLTFSADGQILAIGGASGLFLWQTATKKPPRHLPTQPAIVLAQAFSSSGRLTAVLAAQESNSDWLRARYEIVEWDVATGRGPRRLSSWSDNIPCSIAVSPDGKCLAICPGIERDDFAPFPSDRILLYELASGKEINRLRAKGRQGRLTFTSDGRTLLAGGEIWDLASSQWVGEIAAPVDFGSLLACSPNGWLVASSDDSAILLHALPQSARRIAPAREISEEELRALWKDLSSADAAVAWRAVHALMAQPKKSMPYVQTLLTPHPGIDSHRLRRWLADLDSDQFTVREQARKELHQLGELAELALRRTLDSKPSLEVRRQVLMLLEHIENEARSPEALRIVRVTAVLERIGTAESMALLRRLAGGAAEARLTREAAAAVERWKRRNGEP